MKYLLTFWIFITGISNVFGQNLFLEECFPGGVTVSGMTFAGGIDGSFEINWHPDFELRAAYLMTYRYWRPNPKSVTINGSTLQWDYSSQIGEEQIEDDVTGYFAVHAIDVTDHVEILDQTITATMFGSDGGFGEPNRGWWSLMMVVLYESPDIIDTTCIRIYTASQSQSAPQSYIFDTPDFKAETDLGFSIYADRISEFESDRTCIAINDVSLGCIWTPDAGIPPPLGGVQGHFFYEDGQLFGMNDDIPNETVYQSDGIALIQNFLTSADTQELYLARITYEEGSANPHPAFFISYKPSCKIASQVSQRSYTRCRGDTIQPDISGYDHYSWSPTTGLSDPNVGNPLCFADTSRWYTVTMWSDDEDVCPQTIPIFVDVYDKPEPNISVQASTCPEATGSFILHHPEAASYVVNGDTALAEQYSGMPAGIHQIAVVGNMGCNWEGMLEVPLNVPLEADFRPNPPGGDSPLEVFFNNHSTGATAYQWLIDGLPFSTAENTGYTFADSGTYVVELVAWLDNPACSDTVRVTIRVDPGIQVIVPNIITPNGDGRNDALTLQLHGVKALRWEVFNRWGNAMHSGSAQTEGLDYLTIWQPESGNMSAGTYQIVIVAEGINGKREQFGAAVLVN